ncbi:aldehyde dehydrogenase [Rhizorhabdus wittichii RW1]|uniref:Aldehyde dehydrogenase n=1 Tax=Rhizorhabdus wittichii (strain DSM 6014 / CCUG 31198 / JCM 15750 / NBRC 105917 / EY 4224 / RW1) TaxID=392499 RepID=A0A9J9LDR3_RHIWR|nr:aldehyde dehydrogenase [Rhizorhabdus wittichii RW1]
MEGNLTEYKLLIDGALCDGASSMAVLNPATEEILARCPRASLAQLDQAVAAAKRAAPLWAATPIEARRSALRKIAEILRANATELARLLTQENGKPLSIASIEIEFSAKFFEYFAELDLSPKIVDKSFGGQAELQRRPLGVVAAIIPWNFPVLIVAFKLPAALLAGNTVVLKPAPTTPLATLRIGELLKDVLPPGVLNIITDDNDLGAALSSHPDIAKVTFTGSAATGRKVMTSAANTLKRLTLELGGNDAAIVLDDVDCRAVAQDVFMGAFQNSGQVCLALKRLYVHESIYDEMCEALKAIAEQSIVGNGLDEGVQLGPIQNRMQYEKLKGILEDSAEQGTILTGGLMEDRAGYFIRPTIVRDISEGARLVDEEQFGPILPVIKYTDPEDALRRANDSEYGLGGSIWSSDVERARALANRLQSGTIWINTHMGMSPEIPFGGAKQSGIGLEFGEEGLAEFTQLTCIHLSM